MDARLNAVLKQRGKNITLLIVGGTIVSIVHPEAAAAIMSAVCLAVGAPAVADNWAAKTSQQKELEP